MSKSLQRFSSVLSWPLALITASSLLIMPTTVLSQGIPKQWGGNAYQPPAGLGTPGRRQPAGTRGMVCTEAQRSLTALVPINSYGATVAAYPTFWFYVPEIKSNQLLEFVLTNDNDDNVYKATFPTTGKAGLIGIQIPRTVGLPPLQDNLDYRWTLAIICDAQAYNQGNSDQGGSIFVDGYIRKVAPSSQLSQQLQTATAQEKAKLYAESEIWFDALTSLAELRRSQPNDSNLTRDWEQLLNAVKLDKIAKESFLLE